MEIKHHDLGMVNTYMVKTKNDLFRLIPELPENEK